MKKYSIFALIVLFTFGCSQEEDLNEVESENFELATTPIENMTVDLLAERGENSSAQRTGELGSANNPIEVAPDAFVDYVDYTVESCLTDSNGDRLSFQLERFGGIFFGSAPAGVSPARFRYVLTDEGCYERTSNASTTEVYEFGVYYRIFGEVVQLSEPFGIRGFWFREIPGSDKVQEVTFFEDGSTEIGEPIDLPFERNLDCAGVQALPEIITASNFDRGDLAVRDGEFLYRFDGLFFRFVGPCDATTVTEEEDICEGIDAWVPFRRYRAGDQVTYSGYLFTKLRRGWRRDGECG